MGWLLDWIWHGFAFVLFVRLAITRLPGTSAATRFAIWWVALAGVLAMPFLPILFETSAGAAALPVGADASSDLRSTGFQLPAPPDWLISVALGAWLGGVVLRLARIALAGTRVATMKSRCHALPPEIADVVDPTMCGVASRRHVGVAVTDDLDVPALLGFHHPIVAIPRRLVERLSVRDMVLVVRHELAHAERRDDWSRLAQRAVEALYCFHPAVGLIGQRLDDERELACDDRVIAAGGVRRVYAACLARVAELCAGSRAPLVTPAAMNSSSHIAARIERLLTTTSDAGRRQSPMGAAGGAMLVVAGLVAFALVPPVVTIAAAPEAFDRLGASAGPGLEDPRTDRAPDIAGVSPIDTSVTAREVSSINRIARLDAVMAASGKPRVGGERRRRTMAGNPQSGRMPAPQTSVDDPSLHASEIVPVRRSRGSDHQVEVQTVAASAITPVAAAAVLQHAGPLLTRLPEAAVPVRRIGFNTRARLPRGSDDPALWETVADASVAIGGGAKRAGVATGKFFSRLGTNIARAF